MFWKLMPGVYHQHNIKSYFILDTFTIYFAYVSPTGINLKLISNFLGQTVYSIRLSQLANLTTNSLSLVLIHAWYIIFRNRRNEKLSDAFPRQPLIYSMWMLYVLSTELPCVTITNTFQIIFIIIIILTLTLT